MASGIINTLNSILSKLGSIEYQWQDAMTYPDKLFQFVAVFNDQIRREEQGEGFLYGKPAAFVCVELLNQTNMLSAITQSDFKFEIRMAVQQMSSMNVQLDQNLQVFEFRNIVKRNLINFTPDNCTRFLFVDESTDESHDSVYEYIMTFKGSVYDNTGSIFDTDRTDIIWTEPYSLTPILETNIEDYREHGEEYSDEYA